MKNRMTLSDMEQLKNTAEFIRNNMHRKMKLDELCAIALMNRHRLNKCFQNIYGKQVFDFITAQRMQKSRELLLQTDDSIQDIASATGYDYANNFSKAYKRYFGYSPGEERKV
ncbi:MAG: helix-turn-helix transcriptional regulator [Chitinophagaceae bacterium]|nr:helix-turn-helix transcriptional regulator [Chitinophagaceae bacterium]